MDKNGDALRESTVFLEKNTIGVTDRGQPENILLPEDGLAHSFQECF